MRQINRALLSDFFSGGGSKLYNRCLETVREYSMQERLSSGVLVGLSGGADSVMLLCFLLEFRRREDLEFPIVCVHINHGIRGEEADNDEAFCAELCKLLDVELYTKKYDVPVLAKEQGLGLEEIARNVRYSCFGEIISSRDDLSAIAVAHNMSDNAETVIFNLMRGSGARGAGGIRPVRDNIIRPLIKLEKSDIISALEEFGIPYVTDSSNLSSDYTRNYIRHEIIPRLDRVTDNPVGMLYRFSENIRRDDDYIYSVAFEFLRDRRMVSNKELSELHYSVFVRVLSLMAAENSGSISAKIASDIHALLSKDNFSYSLIGPAVFICERGNCFVSDSAEDSLDFNFEIGEGINHLNSLKADFILSKEKVEKTYLNVYKKSIQANLSSVIISGSLYLRPKKDGDTIYYGGMTHKLKKLFSDRKIPVSKRKRIPILCDDNGVVWVPGFGVRDDCVPEEKREDKYVILGILSDNDSCVDRLYSGSEFK